MYHLTRFSANIAEGGQEMIPRTSYPTNKE